MTQNRTFGAVCGILAAVCYGANPLGAVKLYSLGYTTSNVLLFRFGFAAIILAAVIAARRIVFYPHHRKDFLLVLTLGFLFAVSSITFYESFRMMDVGAASTLIFAYPVLTAVMMCAFFHERFTRTTLAAILLALAGISCLTLGGGEHRVTLLGLGVIFLSALTYAIYIIIVNRVRARLHVSTMTFWILLFCGLFIALWALITTGTGSFRLPHCGEAWFYAIFLAITPTLLSLVFMTYSSRILGATPTAILGALEPLTAVSIGIFVFDEAFTAKLGLGLVLVVAAVLAVLLKRR